MKHEVDFQQLKIENRQLTDKFDSKNQELLKLKHSSVSALQILNAHKAWHPYYTYPCSAVSQVNIIYRSAICEYKIMRIGQFLRFLKTLCDFKLCNCIVRKIILTINFARLKFVHNLIMRSGSDLHKAHK